MRKATRNALPDAGGPGPSLGETTDRLRAEFVGALDPDTITRVVRACRRDLAGAPEPAMPELVERLARVDLTDLIGAAASRTGAGASAVDSNRSHPRWPERPDFARSHPRTRTSAKRDKP